MVVQTNKKAPRPKTWGLLCEIFSGSRSCERIEPCVWLLGLNFCCFWIRCARYDSQSRVQIRCLFVANRLGPAHGLVSELPNNGIGCPLGVGHFAEEDEIHDPSRSLPAGPRISSACCPVPRDGKRFSSDSIGLSDTNGYRSTCGAISTRFGASPPIGSGNTITNARTWLWAESPQCSD